MHLEIQQEVIIEFPSLSGARQGGYPYTPKQLRTILREKLIVIYHRAARFIPHQSRPTRYTFTTTTKADGFSV